MTFEFHIWSLNLNLGFKPTSFNMVASCISSINSILPCHDHASYCRIALIVFFLCCWCCPLSVDVVSTMRSMTPMKNYTIFRSALFIPIQSHSLAPALFYCIRTTTTYLILAAVAEPFILCMTCHCHSK